MTIYAGDNRDVLLPARYAGGQFVTIALNPPEQTNSTDLGLIVRSNAPSVWTCPNRPGLPRYEIPPLNQWIVSYQYYGGITNWINSVNGSPGVPSRSPIKASTSKGTWTLAADANLRATANWSVVDMSRGSTYLNLPPHPKNNKVPDGGNQVFMDGSSRWIKFEKMFYLHSFSSKPGFFYQDDSDFDPAIKAALLTLSARNYMTP